MKKVIQSRVVLLAVLFIVAVSAFSFITYYKARTVCSKANDCCRKAEPAGSSEMLWDVLSRQFVSAVSIR